MRVLVTGAGGFVGQRLLRVLLDELALSVEGERLERIDEIILTGRSFEAFKDFRDPRLIFKIGDMGDPAFIDRLFEKRVDSVFHLEATLPIEAEDDFQRGFAVNLHSMMRILELCRQQNNRPRVILASTTAVFGGPLPERVGDNCMRTPQNSFGTAKAIGELLIDNYTRNGYIDGRSLRLPLVIVRPEPCQHSISDRIGALLREPLLGRDVICPFRPESCVPVASVRNAALSLVRMHQIPPDRFGHTRAMNMPALTVLIAEIADAAAASDYPGERGKVIWDTDNSLQDILGSWPSAITADEALRHGLRADASVAEILTNFVDDYEPFEPQRKPLLAVV